MFQHIDYLKKGNHKQQQAYKTIHELNLLNVLSDYSPTLCGTIPIELDLPNSDLDIIMEVHDFDQVATILDHQYQSNEGYERKMKKIRGRDVLKVNFSYKGFVFELFGQDLPVDKQNAYLHMVIEYKLLQKYDGLREIIRGLKREGFNTEAAFAHVFVLEGDPYDALLEYGREQGYIAKT
ncbi:DUF4269 domain-containing protein [Pontibacillus sp. HMF3514]|uniref:DUF4269 domain-containing protein n=1 Tax=Pontibacillus sp. HMF3514 TaxID=2692425 RepID=UPI00131FB24A|nr:DUF4269 domain-containing protein [Pontibacillus sp. HMF3514]QHE51892.1 DUF4269 domain-containing protein [Pontibacillus sp. HMF3514]